MEAGSERGENQDGYESPEERVRKAPPSPDKDLMEFFENGGGGSFM